LIRWSHREVLGSIWPCLEVPLLKIPEVRRSVDAQIQDTLHEASCVLRS